MTTALLVAAGPLRGHRHQPLPRSGSTSGCRGTASPSPTTTSTGSSSRLADVEPPARRPPELLRDHQRRRPRVVRRHRGRRRGHRGRARAEAGTRPTWSTAASPWSPTSSIDHVEYLGPTRRGHRGGEGRDREAGRRRSCSARPTPSSCRSSPAREPGAVVARDVDFGVRANALALGGRLVDLYTPYASYDRRVPPAARRAPSRQRRRSRSPRRSASSNARSATTLVADAFASVRVTGPPRSRRAQPARRDRRHEERRRRARGARRARRGVRRLRRARG